MPAIAPALPIATTLFALAALLIAKRRGSHIGVWIFKPIAAAGFVVLALVTGALNTPYGAGIVLGLVLSMAGDVLLIPENNHKTFKAGLVSFLLGHVAYAAAFLSIGVDFQAAGIALVAVVVIGRAVLRWLTPNVETDMRVPVLAYTIVISSMLVAAAGSASLHDRPDIFVGALLFYLSDFAVARDKFVSPGFWNGAWGLPFYFVAQLTLAFGAHI